MIHIKKLNDKGLELLKDFEGFRSKPYLDSVGIATIGYGNTYYPNKTRVTLQDPAISEEWAEVIFHSILEFYETGVDNITRDDLTQNQFNALVSFAYNVGVESLKKSTLLKLVNLNPNNPAIELEFLKWNKAKGRVIAGLSKRRAAEAHLYFEI